VMMESKKVRQDRKRNPGKKSQKFQNLARSRWGKRSLSDCAMSEQALRGSGK